MASRAVDLLIAYRVIKLLVTPFKNSPAFRAGIIDDKGKVLKPYRLLKTSKEKSSYTMLHRFVFNMKRILGKVGLGSKLGSFAVALGLLLKEDKDFYSEHGKNIERTCYKYLKSIDEFNYTETLNEEYFNERVLKHIYDGTFVDDYALDIAKGLHVVAESRISDLRKYHHFYN